MNSLDSDLQKPGWEPSLDAAVLRSEVLRIRLILAVVLTLLALWVVFLLFPGLASAAVAPEFLETLRLAAPKMMAGLLVMLAYEGLALRFVERTRKLGGKAAVVFRFVNAAVEVSWVSALLAFGAMTFGGIEVFSGPVPFFYVPILVLSALSLNFRVCAWSGLVAASGFLLVAHLFVIGRETAPGLEILTSQHQFSIKALMLLAGGLSAGFVASTLREQLVRTARTVRERDRAVNMFGQHVSPQVAEMLLNQPWEHLGEERHVCVMFLDIRNFSVFAGDHSAPEVVAYLNKLFGGLITCVNAHRGIVNKFLGDGFMAVFGAPADDADACLNAVRCSQALLAETRRLVEAGEIAPTRLGIGLHFGEAVTGNVGSEERKEYTVIGDTVNLAARIEQATKLLKCELLVSHAVWTQLPEGEFHGDDMGLIELKGQANATRLFRLG